MSGEGEWSRVRGQSEVWEELFLIGGGQGGPSGKVHLSGDLREEVG